MNEVIQNILSRRSVRIYKEEQISDEDLNLILEAAQYSPSGMNTQTWNFTVIQNKERIQELNSIVKEVFSNSPIVHLKNQGISPNFNIFYNAPTLVIVTGDKATGMEQIDCAMAIQNMFLAANSLGIGSCWIHALNIIKDDPKIKSFLKELEVPEKYEIYGTAILGFNGGKELNPPDRKKGNINIIK